ncbi:MAG: hypothetical protein CO144_01040 [Candidatus Nealsonbacteria bacterium CG_4_9_14_3_um_filter_35_11]|uniref:Uncharacterized protein n=2 Tax=Candidatus Nealsoniibacteriota TaxID=1817911 RepID=A0A2M7DAM4_9BACT|nr:MAG: hypothetical protein COV62_01845 [Candidatus Nealsonbacteria bacterium CG11_big_fil_rev_8_21_14_0_20_35_11]PIV45525.1 MAG: hypothetical protein COS24_01820 [Candidatus Nealsonbacteria bacterium CG02_land_8_20_14_3_00_34_20]PIW92839.1 MAG: hypothetical protein COZ88_00110 [Candidatus Nealsonbacteria bacterium CG_4_8_14_3_um_filter_34_13]PIZ89998.1 MAG: hypothetical protein COX88_00840 [Candidatus Nealsonbacteria bacterium CG_4_10_14_0_2_um_filter_35_20]PJA84641.1 MAG: hypothetical protei
MVERKFPKSIRKFIRKEKARIRREVLDMKKQEELIGKLYTALEIARSGKNNKEGKSLTE